MDEKKISEGAKENIVLEKNSAEKEYNNNQLNDELERLAQTFRDELKKAKELSDDDFIEAYADDLGVFRKMNFVNVAENAVKIKVGVKVINIVLFAVKI